MCCCIHAPAGHRGLAARQQWPATILLDGTVRDLPALAAGVGVSRFGCVLGSTAKRPSHMRTFRRISIPFLLVCAVSAALLRLG